MKFTGLKPYLKACFILSILPFTLGNACQGNGEKRVKCQGDGYWYGCNSGDVDCRALDCDFAGGERCELCNDSKLRATEREIQSKDGVKLTVRQGKVFTDLQLLQPAINGALPELCVESAGVTLDGQPVKGKISMKGNLKLIDQPGERQFLGLMPPNKQVLDDLLIGLQIAARSRGMDAAGFLGHLPLAAGELDVVATRETECAPWQIAVTADGTTFSVLLDGNIKVAGRPLSSGVLRLAGRTCMRPDMISPTGEWILGFLNEVVYPIYVQEEALRQERK